MILTKARKWLLLDEHNREALIALHRPQYTTDFSEFLEETWTLENRQLTGHIIISIEISKYGEKDVELALNKLAKFVLPRSQIDLFLYHLVTPPKGAPTGAPRGGPRPEAERKSAGEIDVETLALFAGFIDIALVEKNDEMSHWQFKAVSFDASVPSVIKADNTLEDCRDSSAAPVPAQEGKRKPCANCTCGRKEGGQVKSACGSCHLGDEYRCSSCPYLGQPAFDPSDPTKVKLAL